MTRAFALPDNGEEKIAGGADAFRSVWIITSPKLYESGLFHRLLDA